MSPPNPWLSIPLADYEGHMGGSSVRQLEALAALFRDAVERCRPESVAILGVAGGNGLELPLPPSVRRIVGVDINPQYLEETRRRCRLQSGLELHCVDLAHEELQLEPVELVHAAMIFEHAGLGRALDNAVKLVSPGGHLSAVLQLPSADTKDVSPSPFESIQTLAAHFVLIDVDRFRTLMANRGFSLAGEKVWQLPAGKGLWLGLFAAQHRSRARIEIEVS